MNIIYIGQYTEGTTSKMRADQLKSILNSDTFNVIDTHIPFHHTNRFWRSFGFRYKKGILIRNINNYISTELIKIGQKKIDLIWVDKAVFITKNTTEILRRLTSKLVHFTPDPAFTFHISNHFTNSVFLYDFVITTKHYEIELYKKHIQGNKIIYATQGFNKKLHKPLTTFKDKKSGVLFIGHYEKERGEIISKLLNNNINVSLAGIKWEKFANRNNEFKNLTFLGNGVYGNDYSKAISQYQFSWGALSKWIPELHTTRTFEIPACGTALITERNKETSSFFNEDEAIFYDTVDEMIEKIKYFQNHPDKLEQLTIKGTKRVNKDGRDYESILRQVLLEIGVTRYKVGEF